MLYRPFLHYVSQGCASKGVDKRSFACAAACVSVARNIVHITTEMKRKGLLVGAYWFVMYTTYLAILALVFFVLENPSSPTGKDILKDAIEGRETLASLAKRSWAADRCSQSLAVGDPDLASLSSSDDQFRISSRACPRLSKNKKIHYPHRLRRNRPKSGLLLQRMQRAQEQSIVTQTLLLSKTCAAANRFLVVRVHFLTIFPSKSRNEAPCRRARH